MPRGRETSATSQRAGARVKAAAKTRKTRAAKDWAPAWLEAFRERGLIIAACLAADVSRATVWRRRQADEDFAVAFAEAERDVLAMLEDEAVRRALHGWSGRSLSAASARSSAPTATRCSRCC